jgi:hypothetical protein
MPLLYWGNAASVLLMFITACSPQPAANTQPKYETAVLDADNLLHQRLQAVLDADSAFAQRATGTTATDTLDAASEQITRAEIQLQQAIDSLQQAHQKPADTTARLAQIISYFKAVLESRRALSDLRMVVSANSDDSTSMQQTVAQLRTELQEKNKQLATLQQRNKNGNNSSTVVESVVPNTNAPATSETIADLKQRNKNLTLALNNLQVKYFTLGRDYLVLKKEHERTLNELATLRNASRQK